ncbi:MAG: PEP-CTERM sorting domain-containing protein [Myxococcota bacterium]
MQRPAITQYALLALIACTFLFAGAAQSATIASWDIAGSDGNTASFVTPNPGTIATDLTPNGVTPWAGGFCCFTAASDWGTSGVAPDLAKYFSFSAGADTGFSITFEDISLSLFRGAGGGVHGAEQWQLRASHDGFSSAVAAFDISASASDEQVLFSNIDISSVGTHTGIVEFRLYGFNYTNPSDFSGLGNQAGTFPLTGTGTDLIIEGAIGVVPEPNTTLLTGLGLAGLALSGRRYR